MTKHSLEDLTKAMALELAPHAIRVVSIAPTFVETPLYKEMAAAVVFAASPAASLVTGTSLMVDGGWTAQ